MSSIFGRLNVNKEPVDKAQLLLMQTALNHWNADETGLWCNNHIGLGHLMLHNTPESLYEALPLHNSDNQLSITADARIDNRNELLARLNVPYKLRDAITDSSLIMKAYEQYGEDCVRYLIGDFAFAIWDGSRQRLFCARDHLGVKPFFYYSDHHFFLFASEKKGILAVPGVDKSIDKQFFYNQLMFPGEQSMDTSLYEKIKRLPPAHTLSISAGQALKMTQYWTLDAETEINLSSKEAYYEGLLYYFNEAVKCRTRSHFTVGAELSGGMDSSAITGAANVFLKQNNRGLVTLSNTLPDGITDERITKLDERKYIDAVIEFNKIKEFIYITEPAFKDPMDQVDFSLYVNDGMERWDPLWQLPLKKAALQRNIRTLLSGFPGDELITYRGKNFFMDYLDKKQYLRYFFAKKKYPGFSKLEPLIPYSFRYGFHKLKTMLNLYNSGMNATLDIYNIPKEYVQNRTECVWQDVNFKEQFNSYRHLQKYRLLKPQVNQRMESETRYGLYFRTEPRFPMADIRLAQFYLSMPNHLKYEGVLARTAFRQTVKQYLPQLILERDSKYGSIAPFLSLYDYGLQPHIKLVEKINNALLNKAVILKKMNQMPEKKAERGAVSKKGRAKNTVPSPEILKWLDKNPESLKTEAD